MKFVISTHKITTSTFLHDKNYLTCVEIHGESLKSLLNPGDIQLAIYPDMHIWLIFHNPLIIINLKD